MRASSSARILPWFASISSWAASRLLNRSYRWSASVAVWALLLLVLLPLLQLLVLLLVLQLLVLLLVLLLLVAPKSSQLVTLCHRLRLR